MRRLLLACLCGCGFARDENPPRPRLIAPLSTSMMSGASPVLRFTLPATLADPALDLCRTRACDGPLVHGTVSVADGTATPAAALDAGLWYWRIRAVSPMGPATSAVWQFRVLPQPQTSAAVWGSSLD